jgi:uncharacterized protein
MADAYLIDVASILETLGGSLEITDDVTLTSVRVGTETFEPTGDAHADLTVTNTGDAVVVMGEVSLPVSASCARCLKPFDLVIAGEVDGFYVHSGCDSDVPEEQEVEYIDHDNRIDVLPAVIAALVLGAPFAPLHDEDCAGICQECGADLNEGACPCTLDRDRADGPFSALHGLLEPSEDGETQR